jgi:hypothetical protein
MKICRNIFKQFKSSTMKKTIFLIGTIFAVSFLAKAQNGYEQSMRATVARLDKAVTAGDYQALAADFKIIADREKTQWLPYYYAGFCNAKTSWLYEDDGEKIEPYANLAEEEIKKARSLLDTASQKKELSEIYCVFSMANRAMVFINPQTYGRQYGPVASRYIQMAQQANPDNPRAIWLQGWEKFKTPKLWGGDKNKAKELLEDANQKLANAPVAGVNPHWGKKEVDELLKQIK